MRGAFRILAIGAAMALLPAVAVHGESLFEKLVMPGHVIEGYAKYEKKCESCHEPFSKESQKRLCRDCHKDVTKDIDEKKGMHGKRPDVANAECKHCHTDHKGRKADIIQFDPQTFNHMFTDFELKGSHKQAPCTGCHAPEKKFRSAPAGCIGCHKKDDPHKGELGEDCARCHIEDGWRKPKEFNHAKTKFPLDGAHKEVLCAVCHVGERYKDLPRAGVEGFGARDRVGPAPPAGAAGKAREPARRRTRRKPPPNWSFSRADAEPAPDPLARAESIRGDRHAP